MPLKKNSRDQFSSLFIWYVCSFNVWRSSADVYYNYPSNPETQITHDIVAQICSRGAYPKLISYTKPNNCQRKRTELPGPLRITGSNYVLGFTSVLRGIYMVHADVWAEWMSERSLRLNKPAAKFTPLYRTLYYVAAIIVLKPGRSATW